MLPKLYLFSSLFISIYPCLSLLLSLHLSLSISLSPPGDPAHLAPEEPRNEGYLTLGFDVGWREFPKSALSSWILGDLQQGLTMLFLLLPWYLSDLPSSLLFFSPSPPLSSFLPSPPLPQLFPVCERGRERDRECVGVYMWEMRERTCVWMIKICLRTLLYKNLQCISRETTVILFSSDRNDVNINVASTWTEQIKNNLVDDTTA